MPQLKIFVYDITQTVTKKGKNYQSNAVITIRDTDNNPVVNAMVFITWSGVVSGNDSRVAAADGTVTFDSVKVKSTGPYTITVDNVTHSTLQYDNSMNNETTDTENF